MHDVKTGSTVELRGNESGADTFALSPDLKVAAAVDGNGVVRVWDIDRTYGAASMYAEEDYGKHVYRCGGRLVASFAKFKARDFYSGICVADAVIGLAFSHDAGAIFVGDTEIPLEVAGEGPIYFAISPDRKQIVAGRVSSHGYVTARWPGWKLERGKGEAWDGPATIGTDGAIYYAKPGELWRRSENGDPRLFATLPKGLIPRSVAQTTDGRLLAVSTNGNRVLVIASNGELSEIRAPTDNLRDVLFTQGDSRLEIAARGGAYYYPIPPTDPDQLPDWLHAHETWLVVDGNEVVPKNP